MSKFKGATNLAEKQLPTRYSRPKNLFYSTIQNTGTNSSSVGATILPFSKFDTGSSIVIYPLNERIVLGLRDIKILPENWDTFDSKPPTSETLNLAERVAQLFPSELQPEIMPERDGSIGFYWETSTLEIVFFINSNKETNPFFEIEDIKKGLAYNPFMTTTNIWEIATGIRNLLYREGK